MTTIQIPSGGVLEIEIGGEIRELDVFDVSEELEKKIAPCRDSKDPDDRAWIVVVVVWIQE